MKLLVYFISTVLSLLLILSACSKKKEDINNDLNFYIISNQANGCIYHKIYEPALQINASNSGSNNMSDSIDLDNDGINDICFESYLFKPERWYSKSIQFTPLNKNLQIPFQWVNEVSYLCSYSAGDTIYNFLYHTNPGYCNNSLIKTVDRSHDQPRLMRLNDSVYFSNSASLNWYLCPRGLGILLSSKDSIMGSIENNSAIAGYQFDYLYQGIQDASGSKYLVFKIEENNQIKYGWVNLEISESKNIKIFEIACFQKN